MSCNYHEVCELLSSIASRIIYDKDMKPGVVGNKGSKQRQL
jgi:hypothetical protein